EIACGTAPGKRNRDRQGSGGTQPKTSLLQNPLPRWRARGVPQPWHEKNSKIHIYEQALLNTP
ncbi:MAG: hypothetical protein ACRD2D_07235, partial [Terriglobales bacterium]